MNCSIRKSIVDLYLDYTNNYLTVAAFALDNYLSVKRACQIIAIGKKLNEISTLGGAIKIAKSRRRGKGYLSKIEKEMIRNLEIKIRDIKEGK